MEPTLNVWKKLKNRSVDEAHEPFFILAPMEDVTDTVFRRIVGKCGAPDLYFTEFVSSEGICSIGRKKVALRLEYTDVERPLIAQIWGLNPDTYYEASKLIVEMGFDGIDINMGCPVEKIVKNGACSALIENPQLAVKIIKATKEGAGKLPVSVKTRMGFKSKKTEEWASILLDTGIDALTIHPRLAKDMSKYPADWEEVGKVVKLKEKLGLDTVIVGNGDIKSKAMGREMYNKYGVDGIMIGRGVFDNPWVFNEEVDPEKVSLEERTRLMMEHLYLFEKTWGSKKNFAIMKKFFKIYITGFEGAADFRAKLMECENVVEIEKVVRNLVGDTGLEPVTSTVSL